MTRCGQLGRCPGGAELRFRGRGHCPGRLAGLCCPGGGDTCADSVSLPWVVLATSTRERRDAPAGEGSEPTEALGGSLPGGHPGHVAVTSGNPSARLEFRFQLRWPQQRDRVRVASGGVPPLGEVGAAPLARGSAAWAAHAHSPGKPVTPSGVRQPPAGVFTQKDGHQDPTRWARPCSQQHTRRSRRGKQAACLRTEVSADTGWRGHAGRGALGCTS